MFKSWINGFGGDTYFIYSSILQKHTYFIMGTIEGKAQLFFPFVYILPWAVLHSVFIPQRKEYWSLVPLPQKNF